MSEQRAPAEAGQLWGVSDSELKNLTGLVGLKKSVVRRRLVKTPSAFLLHRGQLHIHSLRVPLERNPTWIEICFNIGLKTQIL